MTFFCNRATLFIKVSQTYLMEIRMRIIIIGLGTIGETILKHLSKEGHTITIIDENKDIVESLIEKYDVFGIVGNGACMDIQEEANVYGADLAIVLTNSDELNIFACLVAKKAGVKIALENMFGKKDPVTNKQTPNVCSLSPEFAEFYDALPKEYFTCCVDIGHCALVGTTPQEMLRSLGGNRVGCLHVHDNDTFDDWHFPPFTLDLDWEEIAKALADIDYKGYITLESDNILADIPTELYPSMLRYMHDAARFLADKVEKYKADK